MSSWMLDRLLNSHGSYIPLYVAFIDYSKAFDFISLEQNMGNTPGNESTNI